MDDATWLENSNWECRAFGCTCGQHGECHRCGLGIYDDGYVCHGLFTSLSNFWWRLRCLTWPQCSHCGKHLWLIPTYDAIRFCNDDCACAWVPF